MNKLKMHIIPDNNALSVCEALHCLLYMRRGFCTVKFSPCMRNLTQHKQTTKHTKQQQIYCNCISFVHPGYMLHIQILSLQDCWERCPCLQFDIMSPVSQGSVIYSAPPRLLEGFPRKPPQPHHHFIPLRCQMMLSVLAGVQQQNLLRSSR